MIRLRTLVLGLVAATLATVCVGTSGAAADATDLGPLLITPATGSDLTRVFVQTQSAGGTGCPAGATNIRAVINGPGAWADKNFVILSKTANGISTTADFSVQLGDNFLNTANANSVSIVAGRYDITLFCQDGLGTNIYGAFTGSVWFTSPTTYTTTDPGSGGPVGTSVSLAAAPAGHSTPGQSVTLTATVTPPTATGTVQFQDGGSPIGAAVPVTGGTASTSVSTLSDGGHDLTAVFAPSDPTTFTASTSTAVSYSVSAGVPDLGTLTFDPATGLDIIAPYLNTHSTGATPGCPEPTTNVSATVTGPGAWDRSARSSDIIALSNTANGVSTTAEMQLRLVDTWEGISEANNAPIVPGRYDVVLTCRDRLGQNRYGTFSGSVWFTDATHYQSTDPATSATHTTTSLAVTPGALAGSGDSVTMTATVTPPGAVGSVQFADLVAGTSFPVGPPAAVSGGSAVLTVTTLDRGLHSLTATFAPASVAQFLPSVSDPVTYVIALPPPPRVLAPTHLVGTPRVGEGMTCQGSFTGPSDLTYAWFRNGRQVSGADQRRVLTASDLGYAVSCRALATGVGGTSVSTSSRQMVTLGVAPRLTRTVSVVGRAQVGVRLTVRHGGWTPGAATYSYRWRRDGHSIARATGVHYLLRPRDRGHRVSVVVLAHVPGHADGRASRLVGRVR